jgi:Flp pilus assembly pilin Flp
MRQLLIRFWREERAESLPEYALLVILICLTAVSTVSRMAAKVNNIYTNAGTHVSVAANTGLEGRSTGFTAEAPANPRLKSKDDKEPKPTYPGR